jgi:alpha-galactosidase
VLRSAVAAAATTAAPAFARPRAPREQAIPFDVTDAPASITVFRGISSRIDLSRHGDEWRSGDTVVTLKEGDGACSITLSAPSIHATHVRLRWKGALRNALILGDAWERSYGDLSWDGCHPEKVLPWYVALSSGESAWAYGVLCGASALAFWQVDPEGLTLWLDVRNGGEGVELGSRSLHLASFTSISGEKEESTHRMLTRFCAKLSPRPRKMADPLIGTNDWYYAYGHNTSTGIERDADWIASLMPSNAPRPFTIVDDGWTDKRAFPDMRSLANSIRGRGARPGIWVRPLQAHEDAPKNYLLSDKRYGARQKRTAERAIDPTIPEALAYAIAKIEQAVGWGYELVKHDFSTYELFGQWGNEMGASPTLPGWNLNDRTVTNAEAVNHLYQAIRKAAGENTCVIGCNTIGHLAAGLFEANRTGDDVSGRSWERTRRMGVNTLAFRLPQNKTFFVQDADCVALTHAVGWPETKQWLDAVARSGSALILSPEPGAVDEQRKSMVRDAVQVALAARTAEPLDWMQNSAPERWRFVDPNPREFRYEWSGQEGASPYPLE